jgi:peptide chain release factor subunit 1
MSISKHQKQKLKIFIRELEAIRGRHTSLVTYYVPAGYELNKIIQHVQQEQGTAANIKDKTTRNSVIDSLERIIRHLRLYKQTPENGLAVFAGDASSSENKAGIQVWSIEPPQPIQTRLYRCDQTFKLDILKDMLDVKDCYGLIVMDNREGNIGLLKGTSIIQIHKMTSGVPGKIRAGGQSAQRFARLREGAAKDFYKRIAEIANKEFLEMKYLKGILIGGPGQTKETFLSGNFLNQQLKDKVLGVRDLSYTGEFGLNELVEKGKDLLAKEAITKEKEIVERFLSILAKEPGKATYGERQVRQALQMGAVDVLLLSEALPDKLMEELDGIAEKSGTRVEVISVETREGVQLKELSGIAAILRYAANIE